MTTFTPAMFRFATWVAGLLLAAGVSSLVTVHCYFDHQPDAVSPAEPAPPPPEGD